jgi:hypothetical protein
MWNDDINTKDDITQFDSIHGGTVSYHNFGVLAEGSDQVIKGSGYYLWGSTAGKTSFEQLYPTCETLVPVSLWFLLDISDTASNI